eukprot:1309237-Prymnesium_polylepis.1
MYLEYKGCSAQIEQRPHATGQLRRNPSHLQPPSSRLVFHWCTMCAQALIRPRSGSATVQHFGDRYRIGPGFSADRKIRKGRHTLVSQPIRIVIVNRFVRFFAKYANHSHSPDPPPPTGRQGGPRSPVIPIFFYHPARAPQKDREHPSWEGSPKLGESTGIQYLSAPGENSFFLRQTRRFQSTVGTFSRKGTIPKRGDVKIASFRGLSGLSGRDGRDGRAGRSS